MSLAGGWGVAAVADGFAWEDEDLSFAEDKVALEVRTEESERADVGNGVPMTTFRVLLCSLAWGRFLIFPSSFACEAASSGDWICLSAAGEAVSGSVVG